MAPAEARARGAKILSTWSSIDFVAVASYLRLGMMPAGPVLTFSGECTSEPVVPSPAMRARVVRMGVERAGRPTMLVSAACGRQLRGYATPEGRASAPGHPARTE